MRFNVVGVMGFALQMATLWLLVRWTGASAGVAVTVAVLAAVSHNFLWHERFTWHGLPRQHRMRRWLSFHLSTGTVSLLTNVGVTMVVMHVTGLPVLLANVVAVALGSLANFWINDRLVFRPAPAAERAADARMPGDVL
ncbi:MAG TPA: GtrA family protein [Vicinamibacterales bacterium]|nr:GtrA family protein [Vicinamibacterales bacterium]